MGVGRLNTKDYDKNFDKSKSAKEPEKEKEDDDDEDIIEVDELENDEELAKAAAQTQGMQGAANKSNAKNEALEKQKALEEKKQKADENKKQSVCPHLKKGRCNYGISGRKEVEGRTCPFKHPRVCDDLLNHGNKGKQGCRGEDSGCSKLEQRSLLRQRVLSWSPCKRF